jgi:hypothetical protein
MSKGRAPRSAQSPPINEWAKGSKLTIDTSPRRYLADFLGFAFFTADFIGERKKVEGGIKNSSLASGW